MGGYGCSRIKEIFMKIFNKIFKRNQLPMLQNVSKENHENIILHMIHRKKCLEI